MPGSKSFIVLMYTFQNRRLRHARGIIDSKVKWTKKKLEKKSKVIGHVIDHALYCLKIVINNSHHLPNV